MRGCLLFISHSVNFHVWLHRKCQTCSCVWLCGLRPIPPGVEMYALHARFLCWMPFVCPDLLPILLRALALGSRLCGYFRGRLLPPNFWLEWVNGRCQVGSEVGGERDGLFAPLAARLHGQEVQWLRSSRKGLCSCQTAPLRAPVTVMLGSCNHYLPYPFRSMNY